MGSQFLQEKSVGDSVKGFTNLQANIHSLSLICRMGHLVIEGDQLIQNDDTQYLKSNYFCLTISETEGKSTDVIEVYRILVFDFNG
ncbi:hypothetical protein DUI87_16062 [Hirundo rustica rustica]|uniref:Uncharacterized protein n=1 Tax=Hirundo rustica rustica TaxID=333673 RepID=A0A3M0K5N5_HIRRU|nr:hypothetical protein DUI87_16062 [Hirundo rustica rustica]